MKCPGFTFAIQRSFPINAKFILLYKWATVQFALSLKYNTKAYDGLFPSDSLQTPRTYCASNTEDLETVVHYVHNLHPLAPLMAAGVSMGG